MFERFTAEARQIIVQAQEESRTLRHGHIGCEHLFLALLSSSVTGPLLEHLGATRDAFLSTLEPGDSDESPTHIPFTPRAKRVLENSLRESLRLQTGGIHPAHLLLGLVKDSDAPGTAWMVERGVNLGTLVEDAEATLPGAHEPEGVELIRERGAYVRKAARAIRGKPYPTADSPTCPTCHADLVANLKCRTVQAQGEGETVPVRLYFCGNCGRTINAGGGDEGTAAHG